MHINSADRLSKQANSCLNVNAPNGWLLGATMNNITWNEKVAHMWFLDHVPPLYTSRQDIPCTRVLPSCEMVAVQWQSHRMTMQCWYWLTPCSNTVWEKTRLEKHCTNYRWDMSWQTCLCLELYPTGVESIPETFLIYIMVRMQWCFLTFGAIQLDDSPSQHQSSITTSLTQNVMFWNGLLCQKDRRSSAGQIT